MKSVSISKLMFSTLLVILGWCAGLPANGAAARGAAAPGAAAPGATAPGGSLLDLSARAKIDTALAFIGKLQHRVSDNEFIQLRDRSDSLFTTSGYINLESAGGQLLRLTRGEFLTRARDRQASYKLKKATLVLNDQFRKGPNERWYCRSTTFHEVNRFDGDYPIPEKVTSMKRKPIREKSPSGAESYWQIIELTLTEN
ncbi:hypothetical protein SAMN05216327_12522 [Dyadobacter sp. SG02]|uniref:hypothetical protein n=1 Tax=Dyadobacter sp. SG02 TaxID=1855291 RepID=UPI0008AAE2A0|nr:hypothetical protein [Dyadobacter sp. SG02]SEJ85018.1 hypothetical protein SAMN05216327_12522 [Dyadobacter sp. SG02]